MDHSIENLTSLDSIDSLLSTINGLYQTEHGSDEPTLPVAATPPSTESDAFTGDFYSVAALEEAGFNEPQISEITLGLEAGLDVTPYARLSYTWKQMQEIRLGLHGKIDTSLYENHLYSPDQMYELRMGLLNHVDAKIYANLVLSATDMHKIRMELEETAYRMHPTGFGYRFTDEESGLLIRISDDAMNAYITLPQDVTGRFSSQRIKKILKKHEITFGLLEAEIDRFSRECPRDMEVKVAHGLKSEPGYDGYYEFNFDKLPPQAPKILADGTVDYFHIKVTESVQAGQNLALYHPASSGKIGSTVTGISITEGNGRDLPPLTGEGIRFNPADNIYKAAYAGNVTYQEDTYSLNVWKIFTIEGDATRYNGSTEYDGTVLVRGDVRNMAHIKATGDIIIEGTVEGAELTSGHNIMVRGGVNAARKGFIHAAGTITGNFFESANLKAGGQIEGNYFLGCHIDTDDKILAKGGKSLIQGGVLNAALGVEANNYRPYGGSKTKIEVGNTSDLASRKQKISAKIIKATDEIRKLRDGKSKLIQLFGEEQAINYPIYKKTCDALSQKEEELEALDLENERLEHILQRTLLSYIKITGTMQPGIMLIINGLTRTPDKQLQRITLNSENLIEEEKANG